MIRKDLDITVLMLETRLKAALAGRHLAPFILVQLICSFEGFSVDTKVLVASAFGCLLAVIVYKNDDDEINFLVKKHVSYESQPQAQFDYRGHHSNLNTKSDLTSTTGVSFVIKIPTTTDHNHNLMHSLTSRIPPSIISTTSGPT